ncbi:MAG: BTAD domain-containing putative transcriptional regulator [Coriobacteriia bacterium]
MTQVLDSIPASVLSGQPRLLLLRATTLRAQEDFREALECARLAAELSDANADSATWTECMLLIARLAIDTGRVSDVRDALTALELRLGDRLDPDSARLVNAYLAVAESRSGHFQAAVARAAQVRQAIHSFDDLGSDEAVFTINCVAAVEGLCCGRWSSAARLMSSAANRHDLSASQRVLVRANLGACLLELGSLGEALLVLDEVVEATERAGLLQLAAHARGTRSSARYALGDVAGGLADYQVCEPVLDRMSHDYVRVAERLNAAVSRRALGLSEEALALAEQAQLILQDTSGFLFLSNLVDLEIAASLLSLGDSWSAGRLAGEAVGTLREAGACSHLLRADLVLAEVERREGDFASVVTRLAAHSEYVMTGSANWLTAMYVRAFPGLLGPLVKALGAESIPLRMLLMLPPETIDEGLGLADALVDERDAQVLRRRRGSEAPARSEDEADLNQADAPSYSCYARLFGGLEVTTAVGILDEEGWRKRKARLLFLILLLKQRQDVPRDVLLERLWPDMDEEHAKRNFYVTWSTMKRALACGGPPSAAKLLVQCTGGVCRITRHVRTDLDDFDEALALLRAASASDDAGVVLSAARRLVDIYRGELLPGDVYEEWFTEARERAKHDFCDAMMAAASIAESHSEAEAALLFLRKASAADAWREDVYQAMMRCQMNSGQRSRAIETYLSCRSRLTEDLGIDPSVETTRLYQAVLAMEEGSGLSTMA